MPEGERKGEESLRSGQRTFSFRSLFPSFFLSCYDRTIDPVVLRTGILLAFRQGPRVMPRRTIQRRVAFDRTIHYSRSALTRLYESRVVLDPGALPLGITGRYSSRRIREGFSVRSLAARGP